MANEENIGVLVYEVQGIDPTSSAPVPPVDMEFELGPFTCTLGDGMLTAKTTEAFPSAGDARDALAPYLRTWRVWSLLSNNVVIDVAFQSASDSLVERPRPAVSARLDVVGDKRARRKPSFISPPMGIGRVSEGIDDATQRWVEVLAGRESMPAGAFGVLEVLQYMYGGRKGVAQRLMVSERLLDELGRLVSTGNTRFGRKVGKAEAERRQLTNIEMRWVESLVEHLLARSLTVEVGNTIPKQLTVADHHPGHLILTLPLKEEPDKPK
jgi:hypothetical protein